MIETPVLWNDLWVVHPTPENGLLAMIVTGPRPLRVKLDAEDEQGAAPEASPKSSARKRK